MRIVVAGAAGVIGRRLVPMLVADGHRVVGTARSPDRAAGLRALGAEPVVVDVFDAEALLETVRRAEPDVVVHQLTDLATPGGGSIGEAELRRTARIRTEGTRNLVEATARAGARRLVAQSAAWLYAPGPEPHGERDPFLDPGSTADLTLGAVLELERLVTTDPRFEGVVLRYGWLYGPTTLSPLPWASPSISVDAAAAAAALAVGRGSPGAYNIVDDGSSVSNGRARVELGWQPEPVGS